MANVKAVSKRNNPLDLENLSQRDKDFLMLEVQDSMKKYNVGKQAVYDRRFAVNKKIKEAGLTVEQVVNSTIKTEQVTKKVHAKKVRPKKTEPEKVDTPVDEKVSDSREVMVVNKQEPVIMKPVQINFDNFSIKLNGVPRKISVNPDTNAIEIDL